MIALRSIEIWFLALVLIAQTIPAAAGGWVLFLGEKTGNVRGPWRTDGTPTGSSEIQSKTGMSIEVLTGNGPPLAAIDHKVIFVGRTPGRQFGLWLTDGTSQGTHQIIVNDLGFDDDSPFSGFGAFDGKLFFSGGNSPSTFALWETDGTPEGTRKLAVKEGNSTVLSATNFVTLSGYFLFAAKAVNGEFGLWRSDGTPAGTFPVSIEVANPKGLSPSCLASLNSQIVLFRGSGSPDRFSLWRTDGTAAGTKPILVLGALNRGPGFAPCQFTSLGNRLVFAGTNGLRKRGLWISDGTAAGTREIKVREASAAGLDPWILFERMGQVYFSGLRSDGRLGIWKTNGTEEGTSTFPTSMVAYSPSLKGAVLKGVGLFRFGDDLWRTDGTPEGTYPVPVTRP